MELIYIALFVYLLAGIIQIFIPEKFKTSFIASANAIATLLLIKPVFSTLLGFTNFSASFNFNPLIGNVVFKLDALSAFFAAIIASVGLIGTVYAGGYLKPYEIKGKSLSAHLFFFNVFIVSMILVVLSQNIIFFLISWEIMSLSSFFLLIFESEKKDVRNIGINYLIKMHVCVLFLIVGFILLNLNTGSVNFEAFRGNVSDLVFLIMFFGFGIKAGIVPVHTWLPKAHPVAPTHVSALMSGVMIKTGIYGILRMLSFYNPNIKISYLVLIIGLATAFFGILYSIAQRNYKKMLAYSSIENIGIICIGIGIGMLGICYDNKMMEVFGFLGCLLHVLNHSLFKTMLFMSVGAVYNQVHTKDMEKLGGLIKKMPKTATIFLLGGIAISAIPPLNGFVSEFLIYIGFLNSFSSNNYILIPVMIISMAILAFVGAMALISFTNAFSIIFLGNPRTDAVEHVKSDSSKSMIIAMGLLACFILLIGLFPQYAINLVVSPARIFVNFDVPYSLLATISKFNIAFLVVLAVLFGIKLLALSGKGKIVNHCTWGCGYDKGSAKIQYSANSFTRPFLGFLTPFYVRELEFRHIKELFPKKTSFKSRIKDLFSVYFIEPIVRVSDWVLKHFYWIQSGNTQVYLLYGVIFLIIAIACLLGGKL